MGEPGTETMHLPCAIRVEHPSRQTFGGRFAADGRLSGTEVIQTVNCDQTANSCVISVPAPAAALVFLSSDAQASDNPKATHTYSTTAVTNPVATQNVDPTALAGSNGSSGDIPLAGTSKGGANGASRAFTTLSVSLLPFWLGIVICFW